MLKNTLSALVTNVQQSTPNTIQVQVDSKISADEFDKEQSNSKSNKKSTEEVSEAPENSENIQTKATQKPTPAPDHAKVQADKFDDEKAVPNNASLV